MSSLYTLGLMIGICVNDRTLGATIANPGMTEAPLPTPLFEGDSIHCTSRALAKRGPRSRPDAGIVEFLHSAFQEA